ncbi:MAG: extracellular solute-binding protein [Planctomycetota bacterium]|nr:MAG: extracellular solute-binding protein [Planctomycetota bacterium]
MIKQTAQIVLCSVVTLSFAFAGCRGKEPVQEVVIYTSLDKVFSQPILETFEKKTGIKVLAVYDSEATKTTGLVNRLIAEKASPQADVFWNSETGRTIVLKQKGILAKYISPSASDIPPQFKDPEGYWTGFAARCRILIYNTDLLKNEVLPKSIFELTRPKWKSKVALAYPLFGTTATHAASLFANLGDEKAKKYFEALKANDVMITDGNASSRDRVADGTLSIGFTDTDDAFVAIKQGKPVDIIWPDKESIGTLLIPNTVALINGGPNPAAGKKLIDFLLGPDVEEMLAHSDSGQIPLRVFIKHPAHVPTLDKIKAMKVDYEKIAELMEPSGKFLQKLFIR